MENKNYNLTVRYEILLDQWLERKQISIKESTYIRYKNSIENHIKPNLGKYQISEINTNIIETFVFECMTNGRLDGNGGLSSKTTSDIVLILKDSFKYAKNHQIVVNCNCDSIHLYKKTKEMRVLNNEETQKLTNLLLTDIDLYKLGVLICLYTGIRIGELCALKWKNISLNEKTIKIEHTMQRIQTRDNTTNTKTHIIITEPKSLSSVRIIPVQGFLINIMSSYQTEPNAFFLSGNSDKLVEPRVIQNYFKRYLKKCEIDNANFHSLRHTFATRCVEFDFDIKTLSEILGHASVKITLDKYVHSSMELKRINMEKMQLI